MLQTCTRPAYACALAALAGRRRLTGHMACGQLQAFHASCGGFIAKRAGVASVNRLSPCHTGPRCQPICIPVLAADALLAEARPACCRRDDLESSAASRPQLEPALNAACGVNAHRAPRTFLPRPSTPPRTSVRGGPRRREDATFSVDPHCTRPARLVVDGECP